MPQFITETYESDISETKLKAYNRVSLHNYKNETSFHCQGVLIQLEQWYPFITKTDLIISRCDRLAQITQSGDLSTFGRPFQTSSQEELEYTINKVSNPYLTLLNSHDICKTNIIRLY